MVKNEDFRNPFINDYYWKQQLGLKFHIFKKEHQK